MKGAIIDRGLIKHSRMSANKYRVTLLATQQSHICAPHGGVASISRGRFARGRWRLARQRMESETWNVIETKGTMRLEWERC